MTKKKGESMIKENAETFNEKSNKKHIVCAEVRRGNRGKI